MTYHNKGTKNLAYGKGIHNISFQKAKDARNNVRGLEMSKESKLSDVNWFVVERTMYPETYS